MGQPFKPIARRSGTLTTEAREHPAVRAAVRARRSERISRLFYRRELESYEFIEEQLA